MNKKIIRVISLILILSALFSSTAFAGFSNSGATPYRESQYIDCYSTYLYSPSSGNVQVWFDVKANKTSDEVGALTIILKYSADRQNWTTAQTFRYRTYSNMLAYDTISNVSHVSYTGESGVYYIAEVHIWVGNNGGGDSRTIYTQTLYVA